MEWMKKVATGATIACMPLAIAAILQLFIDTSVLASQVQDVKERFLSTVERIDHRLDRIEDKIEGN